MPHSLWLAWLSRLAVLRKMAQNVFNIGYSQHLFSWNYYEEKRSWSPAKKYTIFFELMNVLALPNLWIWKLPLDSNAPPPYLENKSNTFLVCQIDKRAFLSCRLTVSCRKKRGKTMYVRVWLTLVQRNVRSAIFRLGKKEEEISETLNGHRQWIE